MLQDVINNYVTIEAAEGVYGVAIDPTTNMIDEERTKRLRGIA